MRTKCGVALENCPQLLKSEGCFSDVHHIEYPSPYFKSRVEREHREQDYNKMEIPRCIHNAIHASGYRPEKPSREVMQNELKNNSAENPPLRALAEREYQLRIGLAAIKGHDECESQMGGSGLMESTEPTFSRISEALS